MKYINLTNFQKFDLTLTSMKSRNPSPSLSRIVRNQELANLRYHFTKTAVFDIPLWIPGLKFQLYTVRLPTPCRKQVFFMLNPIEFSVVRIKVVSKVIYIFINWDSSIWYNFNFVNKKSHTSGAVKRKRQYYRRNILYSIVLWHGKYTLISINIFEKFLYKNFLHSWKMLRMKKRWKILDVLSGCKFGNRFMSKLFLTLK